MFVLHARFIVAHLNIRSHRSGCLTVILIQNHSDVMIQLTRWHTHISTAVIGWMTPFS